MSKLTIVAFFVIVGVLAINGALYDHPRMGARALSSHHGYSTLGRRKRRSILHPFHSAALFHPLLARNYGLNLALRARTLGALSYRNRLLGARGLMGQRLVRPQNVAQIATQVGHHKTPAAVTKVATKHAPQIIPSAPAVVLTKGVDSYPAPADVYQPGPGVNTGIPNHMDQVGLPYQEIFDQPSGGQPLYQPGAPYNGPAGQPADLYNGPAGQPADLYNGPGAPYNGPAGQPADVYNGPGAPYNDPAGAQTYLDPLGSGPIYQGTNGASEILSNGIDVYSTNLGGGFGPSYSNLGLGDYLLDSNGQNSVIFDSNNPSNMAASGAPTGTAGPASAPSFM
ncbi:collagen alpha-1(XVII) chain-like isoform X2 [Haliotis rufescens]|uniref:collagen alpha-1(XVII) chain-like isoform X2 n=1 Tax=Haliotis rufescens TaxID=6454 RepID=UPI00201E91B5|nr:collagen alpha-1(XVII) chain-like isoform X2 [Haliotis rufescens]